MSTLHDELKLLKAAAELMPPIGQIGHTLDLIAKGEPFDRLFFDSLSDPDWLPVLATFGYFSNLPNAKPIEDGREYYPYHLPLFGLAKVAAKAPHAVTSILARLKLPDNPTVGDQVMNCIASISEPSCFPVLHPIFAQISQNQNRSSWIWVQDLLKNWIQLEAYQDVLAVLSSYLTAMASSTDRSPAGDEWTTKNVDEIALGPLALKYPLQIASIVFNALVQYTERGNAERLTEKQQSDLLYYIFDGDNYMSSFGIEDFTIQSTYQTFETILAFRLYQVSKHLYSGGNINSIEMLDQLLRSQRWNLFDRLRWQLYADFPDIALHKAKKDAVERIPLFGRQEFAHYHEFARMLEVFAAKHGESFLSPGQVEQFFQVVINGPGGQGPDVLNKGFKEAFRRKQLWPIASLLRGEMKSQFHEMVGEREISLRSYQPFRSGGMQGGTILSVLPKEAEQIDKYTNEDLWYQLNNWPTRPITVDPENWLRQEDYGAFAKAFADYIESCPDRFLPQSKWWENINRPEPLLEPLRRATDRIQKKLDNESKKPTANDWLNWFGIVKRIVAKSIAADKDSDSEKDENLRDRQHWYWPRTVASDFLIATIQSDLEEVEVHIEETGQLLKQLTEAEDSGLKNLEEQRLEDWYTTAINTVRGRAVEGLLKLALRQKNSGNSIEPWILDFISARLKSPDESPAIFALLGANLRLVVYLFGASLTRFPNLIFPAGRPSCEGAAVVSHFCYDRPMTGIIEVFPQLLSKALEIIRTVYLQRNEGQDRHNQTRDYTLQVGIHICFYRWNNALTTEAMDGILDKFFDTVPKTTRAAVIRQIAWIFEKTEKSQEESENQTIFVRVMQLWERRSHQILSRLTEKPSRYDDFEGELAGFLNWIMCECFPFEWRFNNAVDVLQRLKKLPDVHHVLLKLPEWNELYPERLKPTLQLLLSILSHPSDQLRWQITVKKFSPLLLRGLKSEDLEIQDLAVKCRDSLLSLNLFEFLNLEGGRL